MTANRAIAKRNVSGRHRHGASTSFFIFINGFVLSLVVFSFLYLLTHDLRRLETREMTTQLTMATQDSLVRIEDSMLALADYMVSDPDGGDFGDVELLRKSVPELKHVDFLIWATADGVYKKYEAAGDETYSVYIRQQTFPEYAAIDEKITAYDSLTVFDRTPWPISMRRQTADSSGVVAFGVRKKGVDGAGDAILLGLARAHWLFGSNWNTRRPELVRQTVRKLDSGEVVMNLGRAPQTNAAPGLFPVVSMSTEISMGDRTWELTLGHRPTHNAMILTLLPWGAAGLIFGLTLLSMAYVRFKSRHNEKYATVIQSLEAKKEELETSVAEREELLQVMRKSEREHKALIDSVSDVIFELDTQGGIMFVNETWTRLTGFQMTEVRGSPFFGFLHEDDQRDQVEAFKEFVDGARHAYRAEAKLKTKSGDTRQVEIAFSMLRLDEDGRTRAVGTVTDIEKHLKIERALQEAEQKYKAIFDNSTSGIYQSTPEGKFLQVNQALAKMLGYDNEEELVESIVSIGKQLYADPRKRVEFVSKLDKDGHVREYEIEALHKDGSSMWVTVNARAVRDEKGKVKYYEGNVWDISQRREVDDALREARIEAEITSRSKMEFLANMSHELRTPLNAIIGFSEIIKDQIMGPIQEEAYAEYAKDIYESGNYLLKVIGEILEVSKIETGQRQLNEGNFKLENAINSCMTILSGRIEDSGLKISVELEDDLPQIWGEELVVKQIVLNLLSNALKFTEDGTITVSAHMDKHDDMVIEIKDTGVGMDSKEIEKAMMPFGQVESGLDRSNSGTGLGLTIVDSLVRLHDGSFKMISQKNVGTTARVTLPRRRMMVSKKTDEQQASAAEA